MPLSTVASSSLTARPSIPSSSSRRGLTRGIMWGSVSCTRCWRPVCPMAAGERRSGHAPGRSAWPTTTQCIQHRQRAAYLLSLWQAGGGRTPLAPLAGEHAHCCLSRLLSGLVGLERAKRPPMNHSCTICGASTYDMLCGNRLLARTYIHRLPAEQRSMLLWRYERHQHCTIRTASAVRVTEAGDVVFTLLCGHQVCWVCRGRAAYTPAKLTQALTTRQIRLDQLQRCSVCGDLERERQATP